MEEVKAAEMSGHPVGLVMLKTLEGRAGYIYYIAVARAQRRTGVARMLLEDCLGRFRAAGVREVFTSVEKENAPSERLFESQGFARTSFRQLSKRYGRFRALNMYRKMLVVPGEVLLHRELT